MAFKIRDLTILLAVALIAAACADDVDVGPDTIPTTPDTSAPTTPGPVASGAVQQGDFVSVDYTGTFPNGTMFDTSEGREPLQVQVGAGMTIPGFEAELLGMEVGENKQFTLEPNEAYGEYDPSLVIEESIPAENFGEDLTQYIGEDIVLQTETGMPVQAFVVEIENDVVLLEIDQNHPLAGETLVFDVTVRGIEEMPAGIPEFPDPSQAPPMPPVE